MEVGAAEKKHERKVIIMIEMIFNMCVYAFIKLFNDDKLRNFTFVFH